MSSSGKSRLHITEEKVPTESVMGSDFNAFFPEQKA